MGVVAKSHPRGFIIEQLLHIEQIYTFLTPSIKITSGEILAKEAAEERIWAGRTPPTEDPGPRRSEDQARQDETILHD